MKIRIKNKKRFTIVLSIVLVLIAMISGTYSLFYRESTASRKEDYTTGILSIVAKSKSDNINLTNALPMTDEEGVQTDPYVFTIENTGNLDYNFKIRLLSTSESPINPDYIKLKIDDGEVTTLSSLTNSVIKDNITLKAKEVMDVSIRIWLASNTPNTEIGKSFNSRIVTEGQAIYTQMNNEDDTLSNSEHISNLVEYIEYLYDNAEKEITTSSIKYNYAPSVSLMKDRLGGTTESLDDGNIRYYGATPNNYIDIGDRGANNEVIKWRIIGVFDGKVRIVRDESIGSYLWDFVPVSGDSVYQHSINEWSQADLMKLLNPGYENNMDIVCSKPSSYYSCGNVQQQINNSLWYNSEIGSCYKNLDDGKEECDFTNTGLSEEAKKHIIDQTLYLGGISTDDITIFNAYKMERENNVIQNPDDGVTRTTLWIGKVGLMYPSDYGYAADLNNCDTTLFNYSYNNTCKNSNWLYGKRTWLISPLSGDACNVWNVYSDGDVGSNNANNNFGVRPVLTLSSEVELGSVGDGSSTNPYVLK